MESNIGKSEEKHEEKILQQKGKQSLALHELLSSILHISCVQSSIRQLKIIPSIQELVANTPPILQPIKKIGKYNSTNEYLDIHFKLLREDFIASLRNGICFHLNNSKNGSSININEIKLFKVQFEKPQYEYNKVGIILKLSNSCKEKFDAKNFLYGSLVCFTRDNFKTMIFATVMNAEKASLKTGYLTVETIQNVRYNVDYTMIVSTIFFEPYFQVLKTLQTIELNNFPMKNYIIDVNFRNIHPIYIKDPVSVNQLVKSWPDSESMNSSQYNAFFNGITNEFSLIQGPPGTGKTFTSLKIVKFLIEQKQILAYKGPILVVAFTNHALDQFLSGILKFSNNVVRIGGQSKEAQLDSYNLKMLRKKQLDINRNKCQKKINDDQILVLQNILQCIMNCQGILNFHLFRSIDKRLENSWFLSVAPHRVVAWLLSGTKNSQQSNNVMHIEADEIFESMDHNFRLDDVDKCNLPSNIYIKNIGDYEIILRDINYLVASALIENNFEEHLRLLIIRKEWEIEKEYLTWRLNQKFNGTSIPKNIDFNNPFHLTSDERWNLYHYWVTLIRLKICKAITELGKEFRASNIENRNLQDEKDAKILKNVHVVGMTTTGAAANRNLLKLLKCPIVIIEEAAEVLESHIVSSLTSDCQHLILVGDHKQLRPITAQYNLSKFYNLDISLFERLILNGMKHQQLNIQHRMIPEISKLITPSIYKDLNDHKNVFNRMSIRGCLKNLFFITHNFYENSVHRSTSKSNTYEVNYLLNLASYLIKQGYSQNEITILTTYKEQENIFKNEQSRLNSISKIRVTSVDNFQGEENNIILLSLVRSNSNNNIGFLKTENRVCVALSRARDGLFIIGNMNNLKNNNDIWPKINMSLQEQNAVGQTLQLKCQRHSIITNISTLDDFKKVNHGGCQLSCNESLQCGHFCKMNCHPMDLNHKKYICFEKCDKVVCPDNHICTKTCHENCGQCLTLVEKQLPCGHATNIKCSEDPKLHCCKVLINVILDCGHLVPKKCYENIDVIECTFPCNVELKCGHVCRRRCHFNHDPNHLTYICYQPCIKYNLGCTMKHRCRNKCSELCAPCHEIINKKLKCSHSIKTKCNDDTSKMDCRKKCSKKLACGHSCKKECYLPCGLCIVFVKKLIKECGHYMKVQCHIEPASKLCTKKCSKFLNCGHKCRKRCFEACSCDQCPSSILNNEKDFNFDLDMFFTIFNFIDSY